VTVESIAPDQKIGFNLADGTVFSHRLRCTTAFAWQLSESRHTSTIGHDGDAHGHSGSGDVIAGAGLDAGHHVGGLPRDAEVDPVKRSFSQPTRLSQIQPSGQVVRVRPISTGVGFAHGVISQQIDRQVDTKGPRRPSDFAFSALYFRGFLSSSIPSWRILHGGHDFDREIEIRRMSNFRLRADSAFDARFERIELYSEPRHWQPKIVKLFSARISVHGGL
jgi:hypothetical protein